MKKILITLSVVAFMFFSHVAHGQLINPGFETWSNDLLVPSAMNPNTGNDTYGWWDFNCFNSSLIGSSPISVLRRTDTVHSGSYSLRLQTQLYSTTSWNIYKYWGIPFIGHEYNDTLGIVFNGKVNITAQTYVPGILCTQKLTQFKFYYLYHPNINDTAECRVSLMSAGSYVAGGVFKTNVSTGSSGWQQAVINFTYVSGLTPDTLYVLFSSSSLDNKPKESSILWIDDASIVLPTGIEQTLWEENRVSIYPNPAFDEITVDVQGLKKITISDLQGKQIFSGCENEIDVSQYSTGMYIVKVTTDTQIITRKLIKQ